MTPTGIYRGLLRHCKSLVMLWGLSCFALGQGTAPVVNTEGTWTATKGSPFTYQVFASNTPTSFSVLGTLPPGLTFNSSSGQISGTPTTVGAYTVTLGATNSGGAGSATLILNVTGDLAKGNDISWLEQMAGSGFNFYDADGTMKDADQINNCLKMLKERHVDTVRLRVLVPPIVAPNWDNELSGNSTIDEVVPVAAKAQALGFRILISIDYSWTLADPGNQRIPVNWVNQITNNPTENPIDLLAADISAHTTEVLTKLKAAGVTPEWVALGNEITNGMLLHVENSGSQTIARQSPNYGSPGPHLAEFINAGYYATKNVDPNIKVVLHIDRAHSDSIDHSFFQTIQQAGGHWDVSATDTSADLVSDISQTVNDLATTFNQPGQGGDGVLMMEMEPPTIYPNNSYNSYGNYSTNTDFDFVTDITNLMRAIPGGKAQGTLYWEGEADPDWRGYLQAAWENEEPNAIFNAFLPSILQTKGTSIVDANGTPVQLKGANLGGLMVMEPWMTPADASGLPDEYSIIKELDTRFGVTEEQSLIQTYRQSWITSQDFDDIKTQGMNVIRVPVWWGDFYTLNALGTTNPVMRSDAFTVLDSIVKTAAERGIYTVIDMHGVFGGQSTSDDTGYQNQNQYWTNGTDQTNTQQMWSAIAAHYNGNAWVAGYDLLNEPSGAPSNAAVITALNGLYSAVRAADPNHMIFVEGTFGSTWGWGNLPNPSSEKWTNVVYEMHEYQFTNETVAGVEQGAANQVSDFTNHISYNVPAYIGEFNAFGTGTAAWQTVVNDFNNANMSWSSWSYKATHGAAPDSWGLYDPNGKWSTVPNITTDSSSTISSDWSRWTTANTFALNPMISTVLIGPASILSVAQATAESGTSFSFQVSASDSPTSYQASNLPPGLTINATSGLISGTPASVSGPQGYHVFNVGLSADTSGGTVSGNLRLKVNGSVSGTLPPAFFSGATDTTTTGELYLYTIQASNVDPSTIKVTSGLPPGLALVSKTIIEGTPTQAGTYTIAFSVSNAAGKANGSLVLTVNASPTQTPTITSPLSASALLNAPFTYAITATNSSPALGGVFGASGLPPGLTVNNLGDGVISGTPTKTGIYSVVISSTNVVGATTSNLTLTVGTPSNLPVISSAATASGTVGSAFTYTIAASNGPTSFNATGLPPGLSINATTGVISGQPTATGTSMVTLSATNATATGTGTLALSVNTTTSVPSGWSSADIGSPAFSGSALLTAPGSYTVTGGGADIWGTSDQFHFVDVPWIGDGVLIAQVLNLTNTNSSAKAGLMFRQSLANNASNVLVDVTPSNGSEFNDRATTGGSTVSTNTPGLTAPVWIKLIRTGTAFFAFSSTDGVTWTAVPLAGTADTVAMTDPIYAGLIVNSHNAAALSTAHFANVTFLATPSGLAGLATATHVALNWTANPNSAVTSETAYDVERSPSGANTWTVLASTLPMGTTSYTDSTIASGQSYDYRVRSLAANGQASSYDTTTVLPVVPVISSATTATGTVGTAFTYTITASNGATGYGATGLPTDLTINTSSGVISGTPTTAATYPVTLTATNAGGTGTKTLTLTISPSGYASWIASLNMEGLSTLPSATPFNDGVPNLFKYIFGIDPTSPMNAANRAALPQVGWDDTSTADTTYLTLTFGQSQAATTVPMNIQISSDLQNWLIPGRSPGLPTDATHYYEYPTEKKDPNGDPYMEIEVLVPPNVSKEFIRLNLNVPTQ